jgi:hypothetical protein
MSLSLDDGTSFLFHRRDAGNPETRLGRRTRLTSSIVKERCSGPRQEGRRAPPEVYRAGGIAVLCFQQVRTISVRTGVPGWEGSKGVREAPRLPRRGGVARDDDPRRVVSVPGWIAGSLATEARRRRDGEPDGFVSSGRRRGATRSEFVLAGHRACLDEATTGRESAKYRFRTEKVQGMEVEVEDWTKGQVLETGA